MSTEKGRAAARPFSIIRFSKENKDALKMVLASRAYFHDSLHKESPIYQGFI